MRLFILAITLMLGSMMVSCEKDCTSNCGIIQDDAIEFDNQGNSYYTLLVESECTGVNKKVYVSYSDWLTNHVGDYTCITGSGTWMVASEDIVNTIHVEDKNY